jgi:PAS domain S-box-containing protein
MPPHLQQEGRQVKALSDVIDAVARAPRLEDIYTLAMEALRRALDIERASILLFDPDGVMRFKAWLGISDAYRKAAEGHTPWPQSAVNPPPLIVPDVLKDSTLTALLPNFEREGVRALAFIPLVYRDRLLGKFMLYSREPTDFRIETPFALTLGRCIAFAIDRNRTEAELRATTAKYCELVDTVEGVVWETDEHIRFTFVSKQTESILGYPLKQWMEEDGFWASHIHPDDRQWCVDFCTAQTKALLPHKFEYRFLAADGRVVWLRDIVSIVLKNDGTLAGLRGIMIDITDRKLQEQKVREESDKNVRLRDDFISIASHELKTPLTAIRMQFQIIPRMLKDVPLPGKDNFISLFQNSLRQLDQFSKLSDELLDVSRIGAGRLVLNKEAICLSGLVGRVVEQYRAELKNAGCEPVLHLEENIRGEWDPSRVEQILVNLLTNAMKFGAGKPIEITTRSAENRAELEVRDHGIGLAKENHERIFERFERVESVSKYRGLGLGLYISRQIAEAHGGKIRVESEPGRGAAFILSLPLLPAASLPIGEAAG